MYTCADRDRSGTLNFKEASASSFKDASRHLLSYSPAPLLSSSRLLSPLPLLSPLLTPPPLSLPPLSLPPHLSHCLLTFPTASSGRDDAEADQAHGPDAGTSPPLLLLHPPPLTLTSHPLTLSPSPLTPPLLHCSSSSCPRPSRPSSPRPSWRVASTQTAPTTSTGIHTEARTLDPLPPPCAAALPSC